MEQYELVINYLVDPNGGLCSPETFDFIYPSMWHGKEE
jgi:hypothetical protein